MRSRARKTIGSWYVLLVKNPMLFFSIKQYRVLSLSARDKIEGSCEQLMDECIFVPLFQNDSLCETKFDHREMNL